MLVLQTAQLPVSLYATLVKQQKRSAAGFALVADPKKLISSAAHIQNDCRSWKSDVNGRMMQMVPAGLPQVGKGRTVANAAMSVVETGNSSKHEQFVELAHRLADTAGEITRKYFRSATIDIERKTDASPVTIADRAAEAAMREIIKEQQPAHAVFGEEAGLDVGDGTGDYVWVLDPIDGTKSFITGKPLFGTLIALAYKGVPVLGIIDQPVLKERWLGVADQPSTLNGKPIQVRPCPDIGEAYMYSTTPHMFSGKNEEAWLRARERVRLPLYGCDCYAYGLLAAGHVDLVVEADLKPYDYMALVPIIEGAGGLITDWRGAPLTWNALEHSGREPSAYEVAAAGDKGVHAQLLKALDWQS